ncbi:polyphosphate polymerase domain-containing protein [Paeniglutamicibacter sp. Y32M11]|uniref:polyphosphate polymerase domain-containing protein n=1 Tax=Paeniglutamicibacter sp. Y32M11 TaxID=2853258 RepID=UPI0010447367|nr:polyphosphate polymerase domain-containing protein [Paeniglutamicibacter sp. Y32M11]QXQ09809.1 polyphosphate polymerase domain-containing protein [Paeniglutamicibacter sp. Y32M11]
MEQPATTTSHEPPQDAPLEFAARLDPIGLEELNVVAALQIRVDRKYVVPLPVAMRVLSGLESTARVLHMDGLRRFGYNSVYFDTPEALSYKSAATGRRRRFKIRTRSYLDTGTTFLEVKTEGAREATVKERIEYDPSDRTRLTDEGHSYIAETLEHTLGQYARIDPLRLSPVIETDYNRTTLFLPGCGSRVTIDEDLLWRLPDGSGARLAGSVVIETKSGSSPGTMDRRLWAHGIRPSKISKFATGLALLHPQLPANKWHKTLTHTLQIVPLG